MQEDGRAIGVESYENVQLLQKNGVVLFSSVVPCIYHKAEVEQYYKENCFGLNNQER